MPYDEELAGRVRKSLAARKRITEKRMFGGLAFLMRGRMCCGVLGDDLVVRVGPERYAAALSRPHVRPMEFTGRPITGFIFVDPRGVKTEAALAKWLREASEYISSIRDGKARPRTSTTPFS